MFATVEVALCKARTYSRFVKIRQKSEGIKETRDSRGLLESAGASRNGGDGYLAPRIPPQAQSSP